MNSHTAISTTLTVLFLGLFLVSTTGCPFGSGACKDSEIDEHALRTGVYQAIADPEERDEIADERGAANRQTGDFPYNDGADNLEVDVDRDAGTVEIRYTNTDGREVVETWAIEQAEFDSHPPTPDERFDLEDAGNGSGDAYGGSDAYRPAPDTNRSSGDTESGDTAG